MDKHAYTKQPQTHYKMPRRRNHSTIKNMILHKIKNPQFHRYVKTTNRFFGFNNWFVNMKWWLRNINYTGRLQDITLEMFNHFTRTWVDYIDNEVKDFLKSSIKNADFQEYMEDPPCRIVDKDDELVVAFFDWLKDLKFDGHYSTVSHDMLEDFADYWNDIVLIQKCDDAVDCADYDSYARDRTNNHMPFDVWRRDFGYDAVYSIGVL
jgi:hypothetical protein